MFTSAFFFFRLVAGGWRERKAGKMAGRGREATARLSRHEVARQVDLGRLWIILDGLVVDATDFARCHPGGAGVIARLSGMDASADFKAAGHSAQAQARVAGLVVGVIGDGSRGNLHLPRCCRCLRCVQSLEAVLSGVGQAAAGNGGGTVCVVRLCWHYDGHVG